jgi:hypothetical protein
MYIVDRLSIRVYLRLTQAWPRWNREHFSVASCNILSTPQCVTISKFVVTVFGLKCPTHSLCIDGQIIVQKLYFWHGDKRNCSKILLLLDSYKVYSCSEHIKQVYNVMPAKTIQFFFFTKLFQLPNTHSVSVSTYQNSSFRWFVSRNLTSSVGTVTKLWAGRLKGHSSIPGRARNFPFSITPRPLLGPTQPSIQ